MLDVSRLRLHDNASVNLAQFFVPNWKIRSFSIIIVQNFSKFIFFHIFCLDYNG